MKGRKPIPTALKIARGAEAREINWDEPKPNPTIPDCPEHLKDEARREWDRITPDLHAAGLLAAVDRTALAAYCQTWARWVEAEVALREHGPVVKSPSGYPMLNPHMSIVNRSLDTLHRYLVEFGMSPSSRTRIRAVAPKKKDDLEKFLDQAGKRA